MVKKIIGAKEVSAGKIMIIARTDARAVEGLDSAIDRARIYKKAGADIIFPEALLNREEFVEFRKKVDGPLLANMTEFGVTPYIPVSKFRKIGYNIVIFPVTTFRAAMKACQEVLRTIKKEGTQKNILNNLMSRQEVYKLIDYYFYENEDNSIMEKAKSLTQKR